MITTLTILKGRVAQAFDYADGGTVKGVAVRGGPAKVGGEPIAIDFEIVGDAVAFNAIRDMDTLKLRQLSDWPPSTVEALESHCRAFAEQIANLRRPA